MNIAIQIGLVVLTGLVFLVRLACAMVQASDDEQAIRERNRRVGP
jgi:hypothetical protein